MGTISDYICSKCVNTFNARCGGGFYFVELRCEDCDDTQRIDREDWPVDMHSLFKDEHPKMAEAYLVWPPGAFAEARAKFRCQSCGGQVRDDLKPMCPKCRSRDVMEGPPTVYFD